MHRARVGLGLVLGVACEASGGPAAGECVADGGPRLLVTATDFSTGALSVLDVDDRCVQRDVALASTDAIPYVHEDLVYVVNRFMHDYVDVLDPEAGWALLHEQGIQAPGASSTNPRALAIGPDGLAYVALYGAPDLQVYDLAGGELVHSVDLARFADDDGVAEAPLAIVHAQELFVVLERLDSTSQFVSVDEDLMVVIDLPSKELVDLDPALEDVQGLALLGRWPRQWRPVPDAPGEILVLGTGVQKIDLERRTTAWVIDEAEMAAAGIDEAALPQSFDVSDDGWLFIAAYESGYEQVHIYRAPLDGSGGLERVVTGLLANERTLEVVGEEIWFGDTTPGSAGMRAFSFAGEPLLDEALPTGLAPYSVVTLQP